MGQWYLSQYGRVHPRLYKHRSSSGTKVLARGAGADLAAPAATAGRCCGGGALGALAAFDTHSLASAENTQKKQCRHRTEVRTQEFLLPMQSGHRSIPCMACMGDTGPMTEVRTVPPGPGYPRHKDGKQLLQSACWGSYLWRQPEWLKAANPRSSANTPTRRNRGGGGGGSRSS